MCYWYGSIFIKFPLWIQYIAVVTHKSCFTKSDSIHSYVLPYCPDTHIYSVRVIFRLCETIKRDYISLVYLEMLRRIKVNKIKRKQKKTFFMSGQTHTHAVTIELNCDRLYGRKGLTMRHVVINLYSMP